MSIWHLQEAKNKLSKVVEEAIINGPQVITSGGAEVAVVLSIVEYRRMKRQENDLVEFFRSSPLVEVDLDLSRDQSLPRDIHL